MQDGVFTSGSGVAHARFAGDGTFVGGTDSFVSAADGSVEAYLGGFDRINGIAATPDAVRAAAVEWITPGTVLTADAGETSWTLCSQSAPDGGYALTAVQTGGPVQPPTCDPLHDLLADTLRVLNEGCALFDEDHRLIVSNARYQEINAGVAAFLTPGTHWETVLREMARRQIAVHAAGRESAWVDQVISVCEDGGEIEIARSDGSTTYLKARPTPRGGFIISENDITARRRAENLADASEQMLSTILQASPANLCMSQIGDGEIIYQSPSCVDLFGNIETAREQFADPLDRGDFLTELLASGRVDDFPATAQRADGSTFSAQFSARVIDYRGEEVMVSTATDLSDQIAAEQRITEAGMRLRDAIEALSEGFILYDADERVVMANQRFVEMNAPYADKIRPGVHTSELLQAAVDTGHIVAADLWMDDYLAELERGEGGSHRSFEFQMDDGTWVSSIRRPTREGGFVITWLDVTEQKNAATALAVVNDRMRDAIDSIDEGFALFDADDRLIMWNKKYEQLNAHVPEMVRVGVRLQEKLEAALLSDSLPPKTEMMVRDALENANSRTRGREEFELGDGSWFAVSRYPTTEGGLVITRLDITEQKQAAADLSRLNDRMRDAIESLDEGFALFDSHDRLVTWNSRYAELNEAISEVITEGTTYQEILETAIATHNLDDEEATEVRASGSRKHGNNRMQFEFESKDGRWFSISRNPTSEDGFVITRADITGRKLAEEELARQQQMLHQSEKLSALGELLAGVAHELNNPLSVVVGHALMMEEEIDDPVLLKRTSKISSAAERCSRIVKTFLAMARQRPTKLELTSVNTVIETAVDVAGYGLRSAGVRLETELGVDLPPIKGDADQLAQVLANLIVNAEHALADMGAEGLLTISTRRSRLGDHVVIDVADNGPGIPEKIRARIFEPFFTTKTVGEGTGIGLAFCHRVIATHDGQIAAGVSEAGGALFTIRLAVAKEAELAAAKQTDTATERGHVLVVDDEDDVADLITQVLKKDRYTVTKVHSAEAALELLPGPFDVILSDVNMPGLSGHEFLAEIDRRWPELGDRFGFITGDTMSPGAEQMLALAGKPYLEKPVVPEDLRRLAMSILERHLGGDRA
jgi:PAS domain S-box-containing protein